MSRVPNLPNRSAQRIISSQELSIYYRFRISSLHKHLKQPLYVEARRSVDNRLNKPPLEPEQGKNFLRKVVSTNSKYHHRDIVRPERAPLFKAIKYDFNFAKRLAKDTYDDLHDSDEDPEDEEGSTNKPKFQKDPHFSEDAVSKYKKKNEINGRLLAISGYPDLRNALVERFGWIEQEEVNSLFYDFKFISKRKEIDTENLLDGQLINHFANNKSLTTKFGLCRNLRNIVALGKDPDCFYPRCYDVNDVTEVEDFFEDFKASFVKGLLARALRFGVTPSKTHLKVAISAGRRLTLSFQQRVVSILGQKTVGVLQEQWLMLNKLTEEQQFVLPQEALIEVKELCRLLERGDPQWSLTIDNIWIAKPASMSRGRGIKTFKEFQNIIDYVSGAKIQWVVQKYIESPLILRNKKFDLRQWVLVTDIKAMHVWAYEECYARFCAEKYSPEDLANRKVHLTNNSVTKGLNAEDDGIAGNMMSQDQLAREMAGRFGAEVFQRRIRPQMMAITLKTLLAVKEHLVHRKNTMELFGYDFMVDEGLNVWLIEVNSSPTMEHSTVTTTKLVQKGLFDLAVLIQQYMLNRKVVPASRKIQGWQFLTEN